MKKDLLSASTYQLFVQDLFVSNITDYTDDPRDVVTPSVVGEKNSDLAAAG